MHRRTYRDYQRWNEGRGQRFGFWVVGEPAGEGLDSRGEVVKRHETNESRDGEDPQDRGCPDQSVDDERLEDVSLEGGFDELRPVKISRIRCFSDSARQIPCSDPAELFPDHARVSCIGEGHEGAVACWIRVRSGSQVIDERLPQR